MHERRLERTSLLYFISFNPKPARGKSRFRVMMSLRGDVTLAASALKLKSRSTERETPRAMWVLGFSLEVQAQGEDVKKKRQEDKDFGERVYRFPITSSPLRVTGQELQEMVKCASMLGK
ncbi:hypothetical protein KOW79_022206 [Hemibagrus wyckioides]|uniref:Uncharacterized protein n=1 Tax=Hemibagrus wyckioides TaxID=337641 RepID=A0A9D3N208_9TELE|nr:hypothetical protein KOW79_022206 [Hemibagrus wyckioides]